MRSCTTVARWRMAYSWQRDAIVMRALSRAFDTVPCLEKSLDAVRKTCLPGISAGRSYMPDSARHHQLLHLLSVGDLPDLERNASKALARVDIGGVFPNYAPPY